MPAVRAVVRMSVRSVVVVADADGPAPIPDMLRAAYDRLRIR